MTELQKFSPSSLKHTPKKSAITIPPRVIELMEKVSLAAACLSREFQEMTMASEGERQANMLLTIDNFLSEIDTLFLCKIEDISETIPKELFQKIQDLRNFTEQAFIYFIEKGQLEFIGSGTEGAAHRLKVATKEGVEREFIVLKKSHFIQGDRLKNEFEIQEQAHIIASRMHGVEVPRPYMNFSRGEEHYLVMEYIPGKTLYTLQLEQVANKIVLERIFRTIANDTGISEGTKIQVLELLKEFYTSSQDETKITAPLTTPLYGFFERHNQENPIRFENDTVAEEKLMQLLQIAYQINAIDGDPMKKVLDPQFGVEVLELATRLYRMNEKKFPLFLEKESTSIARSLRAFFTELHKKGIYHRDFHPRNIMMGFDGNIRVIDFGYAKSHPSSPYAEEGGGERIDDLNLVNYIAAKKIDKHTPKMDLLAPKIAKQQLLLKNFNFRKLSEHIGLSPKDLELAATLNSYVFSPTFLTNQFDQLVSKKAGVNWEILLKPRGDAMKNSAKAEARWAFAFALLSDAEYEQFITCITALYRSWSPTKKSRADNILKRLALGASIVEGRMLEMR